MTAEARRIVYLVVLVLLGVIVGLSTAWISASSGKTAPLSLRDGGIAFAGTVGLGVTVLSSTHLLD